MTSVNSLAAGLADDVHDSQQTFRRVLDALSRPGQVQTLGAKLPGVPLGGAMARLLLSLCDDEAPVWWQVQAPALQNWLRFHTGASVATSPNEAAFAVVEQLGAEWVLQDFALATAEAPEHSSTLLIELPALSGGPEVDWQGPGIADVQRVGLLGLPARFWLQWQSNHALFPQGVDIIFTCGDDVLGLPRTTRVSQMEGV